MTREEAIKVCAREKDCVQSALDACADGGHYVSPDGIITAADYVEAMSMAISALREQESLKVNKPLTREELQKFIGRCVWWRGETCYCENGYLVTDGGTFSFDWVLSHGGVYCRNPESKDANRCNFCEPKWISVEERLPEVCGHYIVAVKYNHKRDEKEAVTDIDIATWGETVSLVTGDRSFEWTSLLNDWDEGNGAEITHWMPLPEPPKEEV